uniref:SFRICE_009043 n=1 Tax=Spodoptera frugiperda TaxID=7108 RepID=A0A2H1WL98_SPOFR
MFNKVVGLLRVSLLPQHLYDVWSPSRLVVSDDAAYGGARLSISNLFTWALKTPRPAADSDASVAILADNVARI